MTKLNNAQDAIKQAIEGGYDWKQWARKNLYAEHVSLEQFLKAWFETDFYDDLLAILNDPLFWQALGTARGWLKYTRNDGAFADKPNFEYEDKDDWMLSCQHHAHEWFDTHVWHPEQETKFWQSLP